MSNKPTREQLPFFNRFNRLVDDANFLNDLELLRKSDKDIAKSTFENVEEFDNGDINANEVPSPLHQFMAKYNLPWVMDDFMMHYITHDEVDLSKLRNGVYVVDDKNMESSGNSDDRELNYHAYVDDEMHNKYVHLTLAVPIHATTTQINDTITQHKQFIKDRQIEANGNKPIGRVRSEYYALRDKEIMRLHHQGKPPRIILLELPEKWRGLLTAPAISNIIYRRKKQWKNLSL